MGKKKHSKSWSNELKRDTIILCDTVLNYCALNFIKNKEFLCRPHYFGNDSQEAVFGMLRSGAGSNKKLDCQMIATLFQHLRKLTIFKHQNKNIFDAKDNFQIEPVFADLNEKRNAVITNINENFKFSTYEIAKKEQILDLRKNYEKIDKELILDLADSNNEKLFYRLPMIVGAILRMLEKMTFGSVKDIKSIALNQLKNNDQRTNLFQSNLIEVIEPVLDFAKSVIIYIGSNNNKILQEYWLKSENGINLLIKNIFAHNDIQQVYNIVRSILKFDQIVTNEKIDQLNSLIFQNFIEKLVMIIINDIAVKISAKLTYDRKKSKTSFLESLKEKKMNHLRIPNQQIQIQK